MDIQGYPGIFRDIHGLSMDIPSRPLPLYSYVVIAREVDGQVADARWPSLLRQEGGGLRCRSQPSVAVQIRPEGDLREVRPAAGRLRLQVEALLASLRHGG